MSMVLVGYSADLHVMAMNIGLNYYQWDAVIVSTMAVVASFIGIGLYILTITHELMPGVYKALVEDSP